MSSPDRRDSCLFNLAVGSQLVLYSESLTGLIPSRINLSGVDNWCSYWLELIEYLRLLLSDCGVVSVLRLRAHVDLAAELVDNAHLAFAPA